MMTKDRKHGNSNCRTPGKLLVATHSDTRNIPNRRFPAIVFQVCWWRYR